SLLRGAKSFIESTTHGSTRRLILSIMSGSDSSGRGQRHGIQKRSNEGENGEGNLASHIFLSALPAVRIHRFKAAALAGAALIGTQGPNLHAQTASENDGISDIIVTAERRATNLQDTPLSIVA